MIRTLLLMTFALLMTSIASAQRPTPEVRGTWMTTTANDAISTPAKTAQSMRRLREIGLNTIYVECWKNGFTEFPSATMERLIGIPMRINGAPPELQRDLLAEAVIEAHRNQMLCIAWFEYGFMASYKESEHEFRAFAREKGWLTTTRDGREVGDVNSFVWLNPFHPEVQQFLIDIVKDAVVRYDLDGVQLDDRIALPVDLGYDEFTKALYKRETGRDVPDDFRDADWMRWRADKISVYSLEFVSRIRETNPNLIISVSPAPFPWSYENYLCDWMAWTKWCYCGGRRWDEYIPQVYRFNFEATRKSIDEQLGHIGAQKIAMIAGIRIVGDGPDMPWDDLRKSIDYTRETQIAGHCLWYSRGVLEVYPEELKAYYDVANKGHAINPFKPGNWREAPIVAKKGENGSWHATVKDGNRYRLIRRTGDTWTEAQIIDLDPGTHTFVDPQAQALELLVDRRP
jgi:uncharacterized lipoprotein YddW (UPF0748 family)